MHLFSTHSWHVVHCDPVITFVFPKFLSTSISRCGTVGLGVLILIFSFFQLQRLSVLYHNHSYILHRLSLSLSLSPDPASAKRYLHRFICVLWWADWQNKQKKKKNCSGTVCEKRSSSCQILHWDQSGSDSVKNSGWTQSHKQYDKRVIIFFSFFFHMDPCWTIKHR